MKITTFTSILVPFFILSATASVHAEIYKWKDENGQLHYTERPAPAGKKAEDIEDKIRLAADLPGSATKVQTTQPSLKYDKDGKVEKAEKKEEKEVDLVLDQKERQEQSEKAYKKQLKEYCDKQSNNLKALKSDSPIAWQDNGKTRLLSDKERSNKIKSISASISDNCTADKEQ